MPDELDRHLLHIFAESHRPLEDEQFVARVDAYLRSRGGIDRTREALRAAARTALTGLTSGIDSALSAALRSPHAASLTLAALLLSVWAALA